MLHPSSVDISQNILKRTVLGIVRGKNMAKKSTQKPKGFGQVSDQQKSHQKSNSEIEETNPNFLVKLIVSIYLFGKGLIAIAQIYLDKVFKRDK